MIFAPVIRRTTFNSSPRLADAALQRFLSASLGDGFAAAKAYSATQDDKATTLQLDVPGLSQAQLSISIEANVVKLRSAEDAPRSVQRAWELPHEIDASTSSAKLENGVLTLTLGKLAPVSKEVALPIQ